MMMMRGEGEAVMGKDEKGDEREKGGNGEE